MPELPDIVVYMEALEQRVVGHVLENLEVRGPSLLRTADPPIYSIQGRRVTSLRRVGKRIAFGFDNDLWLVFHLMIAGRLHWSQKKKTADVRRTLAAFDFDNGTLTLTEAGTRKRASLHLVRGEAGLAALDPGGIDVFAASLDQFSAVLTSANHTLKRALTDPRLFSGIGNAYSDEILFHAQLSPVLLTQLMKPEEIKRLFEATNKYSRNGPKICATRAAESFLKKSRPSARRWPSTAAMASLVRAAAQRSSASATHRTRPITALPARPQETPGRPLSQPPVAPGLAPHS